MFLPYPRLDPIGRLPDDKEKTGDILLVQTSLFDYRLTSSRIVGAENSPVPRQPNQITMTSLIDVAEPQKIPGSVTQTIANNDIIVLAGHEAEVFCCSWHPRDELLASGSGDSTVRLWDLPGPIKNLNTVSPASKVLNHATPATNMLEEDHDVTTLEWSADGNLLATGCMDGITRLWSHTGTLQHSLAAHSESIFSLRFDSVGGRLLTGSYDKCVSVWDVYTGKLQHKFEAHSAQVLDVDWKNGAWPLFSVRV